MHFLSYSQALCAYLDQVGCRSSIISQFEVLVTEQVASLTSRLLWHVPTENTAYLMHTCPMVRCWFTLKCQQVYQAEHNHHNPTVPPTICCYTEGEIWHLRECSMSKGNDSAVPLIVCFSMHQVTYNQSERRDATGMSFPVFTGLHCYPPFLKDNYILHLFRMFLFCNSVGTLFVL